MSNVVHCTCMSPLLHYFLSFSVIVAGEPTELKIDAVEHNLIQFSWSPPEPCDINGEITGYNVSWEFIDPQYPNDAGRGKEQRVDQARFIEQFMPTGCLLLSLSPNSE